MIYKLIIAAFFVIGLDIIIPFNSVTGLTYVKAHGKWLPVLISIINVFVGAGIAGGFLNKDIPSGFRQWFMPIQHQGKLNPTYGFAGLIAFIHVLIIIGIEP